MTLFGPEQFVFPFLAHALGTLVGAFTAQSQELKWYTDVKAWKIERAAAGADPSPMASSNDEAPPVMVMDNLPDDDLPF